MNTILYKYLNQNLSLEFNLLSDGNIHIKIRDFSFVSNGRIMEEISIPKEIFLNSDPIVIDKQYLYPATLKIFSRRMDFYSKQDASNKRKEYEKFWKESEDIFP
ncbi:MAG: hypothetical protein LIR50_10305 [Bacillota bacterium]|nr:hypothetical protein [Bacillota bacterium]